eukprot:TRINITY_DN33646_c1_g1_i1.p1 TRINITY_DN33646_c1_g1~~TRINITY_DN33646_c1_g1_i1.p1  ORF type:complete len:113 (+),score=5.61 TRINITY_DN33646_c1_g1_i1:62-400(+)
MPGCQIASRNRFSAAYETTHSVVYFVFHRSTSKKSNPASPQPQILLSKQLYTKGICSDVRLLVGINFKLEKKKTTHLVVYFVLHRNEKMQGASHHFSAFPHVNIQNIPDHFT